MQKRHFEAMAKIIKGLHNGPFSVYYNDAQVAASAFAQLASQFNPKFDRARFYKACGL